MTDLAPAPQVRRPLAGAQSAVDAALAEVVADLVRAGLGDELGTLGERPVREHERRLSATAGSIAECTHHITGKNKERSNQGANEIKWIKDATGSTEGDHHGIVSCHHF